MQMPRRELFLDFQLDTNRINSRGQLEHMNQLQQWYDSDLIGIIASDTMINEATAGNNRLRTDKASTYVYSMTTDYPVEQHPMWSTIEDILFPYGAKTNNERSDVTIVFTAWKYRRVLITSDGGSKRQPGGILGNRVELAKLGIRVMPDYEAVELVIEALKEREERARRISEITGEPVPDWVGRDY